MGAPHPTLSAVEIDGTLAEARVAGRSVPLSPAELRLLEALARRRGRPAGIEQLAAAIERVTSPTTTGALRARIARLRKKIEPDPQRPRFLVYDRRTGYALLDAHLTSTRRGGARAPRVAGLTKRQTLLVAALAAGGGRPVPWTELARALGRGETDRDYSAVRLALHRLARVLKSNPQAPRLVNRRGLGYLLEHPGST